jgi:hypothetical protein
MRRSPAQRKGCLVVTSPGILNIGATAKSMATSTNIETAPDLDKHPVRVAMPDRLNSLFWPKTKASRFRIRSAMVTSPTDKPLPYGAKLAPAAKSNNVQRIPPRPSRGEQYGKSWLSPSVPATFTAKKQAAQQKDVLRRLAVTGSKAKY